MPIVGTRQDTVKMPPIVADLQQSDHFECIVTLTGQDREMFDQVNELFGFVPDSDLNNLQQREAESAARANAVAYDRFSMMQVREVLRSGNLCSPLVTRYNTVRPNAVHAGTLSLVGTDQNRIVGKVDCLLNEQAHSCSMANAVNSNGGGKAAHRTMALSQHSLRPRPQEFSV